MGLEKQATGRFDARCDNCDRTLELDAYGPMVAGYKLRQFGWRRTGYIQTAHHYLWMCTKCCDKELAL